MKTRVARREEPDPILVARGQRVAELRLRAGYAKQSHVPDVPSGTLSNIEAGLQSMKVETAETLARAFGVTLEVLLGNEPIPEAIDPKYPHRNVLLSDPEFLAASEAVRNHVIGADMSGGDRSVRQWYRMFEAALQLEEAGALNPANDPRVEREKPRATRKR